MRTENPVCARRPLIVGNWKANGRLLDLPELTAIDRFAAATPNIDIAVAVPLTLLATAACAVTRLRLGSQNFDLEHVGPQTGCVSAAMVRDAGASFSIIGHTEVRARTDNDDAVGRKLKIAAQAGLTPLLCVGESAADRAAGRTLKTIARQLDVVSGETGDLWVAYEPLWTIGTGRSTEPCSITEVHSMLREVIGPHAHLLHGGSITPENAVSIIAVPNVDGLLIGGASLKAESFNLIARYVADIVEEQ